MAITYRYLIHLTAVEEGRQEQLAASLRTTDRRSGRDKWMQLVAEAEAGDNPVVFRTNSSTEADRIIRAIATAGGTGELVDQLNP